MEAIRVQNGKARILNDKCIDCGECIRTCPYKAKVAHTDSWDLLADYKYTIALPAPSLYMQFDTNIYSRKHIIAALKSLGFDFIYEVAVERRLLRMKATNICRRIPENFL